jgi:hypothetical protein
VAVGAAAVHDDPSISWQGADALGELLDRDRYRALQVPALVLERRAYVDEHVLPAGKLRFELIA